MPPNLDQDWRQFWVDKIHQGKKKVPIPNACLEVADIVQYLAYFQTEPRTETLYTNAKKLPAST